MKITRKGLEELLKTIWIRDIQGNEEVWDKLSDVGWNIVDKAKEIAYQIFLKDISNNYEINVLRYHLKILHETGAWNYE